MFERIRSTYGALAAAGAVTALLLAGCGGSSPASAQKPVSKPAATQAEEPASGGSQTGGGTPVAVSLGETDTSHMYMKVDTTKAPAGPVTFTVTNDGVKTHEFVVLDTPTEASEMPLKDDEVDEAGNIGETGDVAAGETKTLTLDLHKGHYALVCNLKGHVRMGMTSDLQVS